MGKFCLALEFHQVGSTPSNFGTLTPCAWEWKVWAIVFSAMIASFRASTLTGQTVPGSTVYSLQYTLYCIQYTVYSIQHTVYSIQYTVYSIQYTVYCIQYTVYSILYTVYSIQYTVYSIQHTVYIIQYSPWTSIVSAESSPDRGRHTNQGRTAN